MGALLSRPRHVTPLAPWSEMSSATTTPADDVDCPECRDQKERAAERAADESSTDGLRLGKCAPLYQLWADCIEREQGQAKACTAVLKTFKECHDASVAQQMDSALKMK